MAYSFSTVFERIHEYERHRYQLQLAWKKYHKQCFKQLLVQCCARAEYSFENIVKADSVESF